MMLKRPPAILPFRTSVPLKFHYVIDSMAGGGGAGALGGRAGGLDPAVITALCREASLGKCYF